MANGPFIPQATGKPERLHDIDWLRVIAVLLLIVFHSTRPFDFEPWHARNAESSRALALLGGLLSMWRLPLLFLVSGTGTFFALGHRSGWKYARDRFRRLVIPLVATARSTSTARVRGCATRARSSIRSISGTRR